MMPSRTRTGLALASAAAAGVAGLYLAGWLALALLQVDAPLRWDTWWGYARVLDLPQLAPHAGRVRLAGWVGFGLPALVALVPVFLLLRPRKQALHGDARFARGGELARLGLLKPSDDGLVVGRLGRKLVRLPGQQFALLAAPTRSGKGVGVVVPNLLEYRGSVVVLDIKQENFDLTSGWRAAQGQAVYLFNPFAEDGRTHRWNPLAYVSQDPSLRVSDLQAIAAMLYPDGDDKQKFWVSQARNAFLAFALYLFENFDDQVAIGMPESLYQFPTLGRLFRLSSGDGTAVREYLQALSRQPFLGEPARNAFATLLSQADETLASILGTLKEPLNPWVSPVLDAATSANDFLLTDVRKRPMSIYVAIAPNKLAEARLILNLFFSQLIHLNTRELPQANPALRHQCLLLMDEFTAIGRVDIIASAVAYMAGYNLRLLPLSQSLAQLDAVYGKDVARTLVTNHAMQILFAPREQRDANDYSEMLGYTTVRRRNKTRQRGLRRDVSISESEERRALMLPQELKAMGPKQQVLVYEGLAHPIKCTKIRYYEDRHFTARLLPPVHVPALAREDGGITRAATPAARQPPDRAASAAATG